jgi:type I restriction enzyme S subunit
MTLMRTITLDDACEFIVDCLHHTAPIQKEGYPSIRTPNIGKGRLLLDGVNRVSEETYQIWTQRAIPEPTDLILAREAPAGNVAIIKDVEKVCLGQRTVHLRPNTKIVDPDFLCYFLLAPLQQGKLLAAETGATAKHVNMLDIRRLELSNLPNLSYQQSLGAILATYDDLIENNSRRMTLLEDSARLLYNEWFVRLRFPGYEHTRIVDGVPEGWEYVPTSEAVEINPKIKLSDDDKHCYVEMAELSTDSMVIQGAIMRDGRSGSKFQNCDTLFARITPCLENGKTGFVNFMRIGEVGRGSTEFIVLRSKRVTPEFVYCLARTYQFRENAIKSMIGSSGRQRVQVSCFDKLMVYVPSASLLRLFSEFTTPVFEQIKTLHAQNQKLRTARDLLLPRLMSGEIAV